MIIQFLINIISALLTCILELPVVVLMTKNEYKKKYSSIVSCLVNIITNILLNGICIPLILIKFQNNKAKYDVLVLEIIIVLIEFLIYMKVFKRLSRTKLFFMSLIANSISFLIGLVIFKNTYSFF